MQACKSFLFHKIKTLFFDVKSLFIYFFACLNIQAEEENNALMKKINQLDNDLDKAQEQLAETNNKLEEANKKSADVSVKNQF